MTSLVGACVPDASSPHLSWVAPSIQQAFAGKIQTKLGSLHSESIMLIMIDGLGFRLLEQYRGHARNLWGIAKDTEPGYTCAPSTTAAAITTTLTGYLPGATNMVGYSAFMEGRYFDLITFKQAPELVEGWQPMPTLAELLSADGVPTRAVLPDAYHNSGLTHAALRGAELIGAESPEERVGKLSRLLSVPGLTYGYWSEVDHAGHLYGVGSDHWIAALEETDAQIGVLIRQAGENHRIIIVADHGMVNAPVEQRIDLLDHPQLAENVITLAGEPRAVHVHTLPGAAASVRDIWAEYLDGKAWIPSFAELANLQGGASSLQGSFVAYAKDQVTIVDSRCQSSAMIEMPGVHGSLTETEMQVPILVR
ncbi:alkaline phosphatase family protein [Boudabousia marimammalium]|uniref:Alkaline phosphatase family protein n=1 Tax=Boudabousia marimammalium TaxID=156892 RepID=A0A1Q5PQY1_9ACTO|nr:alkaline phosphatase family protein [Boudabousia marimammalium]OKL49946.1 hypothetical protein BM477_03310 [Boudabousia marimammalium]